MNSSIDWTTPDAYMDRFVSRSRKRSLLLRLAIMLRIAVREQARESRRAAELRALRYACRDLPVRIRRDIGLPPIDPSRKYWDRQ